MNTMAPTRPLALRSRQISLTADPGAAAEARSQVRAALRGWGDLFDPTVAVLLTSELVTNAIRHETGDTVQLVIICDGGELRVEVHDSSWSAPVATDAPADAEAGRGLMLVASMSADWGFYRTPAGKAVYFTLTSQAAPDESAPSSPQDDPSGLVNREPPAVSPDTSCGPQPSARDHRPATVRKAASRAMSVREWTSSFFRM